MKNVNYDLLEKTILLFWDDKANFESTVTQNKIGGSLFQKVNLIDSLSSFEDILASASDNGQLFLFLVHLHHSEKNKGIDTFRDSKIGRKYPNLRCYYISSTPKSKIYEVDGNSALDIFSYDNYHNKIGDTLVPQRKQEIENTTLLEAAKPADTLKRGIFLSHSSKDRVIVERFRDIVLGSGLNFDLTKVKFTSEENLGLAGGINIPEDLRSFIVNDMGFFIQFISPDYLQSRVCLNEEGVGWCLLDDVMFLPILIGSATPEDIGWIKATNKGIKINNRDSLLNIYQHRQHFFKQPDITHLTKKVEEFINSIK